MNNNNNMQQSFQMFLQWMNNYNNFTNNYNFNNNQYRNNNNNFNANGDNNNINHGGNPAKETLPRNITITNPQIDYPEEEKENLKNIFFLLNTGVRVTIVVPYYETLENLFLLFAKKIGIGENTLGKDIFFIFDTMYLQIHDKRALYELFFKDNPTITVIDTGFVIGGK